MLLFQNAGAEAGFGVAGLDRDAGLIDYVAFVYAFGHDVWAVYEDMPVEP